MNSTRKIQYLFLLCFLGLVTCEKDKMTVSTGLVSNILPTSANISGTIIEGEGVKQFGHCYSETPDPTVFDKRTELGVPENPGDFTSLLQGLEPGTKYYVKAYLSDEKIIVYGNEVSFNTTSFSPPEIITADATFVTSSSAISGGTISAQEGIPVITRGVCWSTSADPTIANSHTANGSGDGEFASYLEGLEANTFYHVRAYATNSGGTYYGNEITFTTLVFLPQAPVVTTAELSSITAYSAICGGDVISEGTAPVTAKGICWSTSPNPTILNFNTVSGNGLGPFTGILSGLSSNTVYYLRAYATNSVGTAYGSQIAFTTLELPEATTTAATVVTSTTARINGIVSANNSLTTVSFVYGPTTAYGSTIPGSPSPISGDSPTNISAVLTGLSSSTFYHYRIVAENEVGTVYGNDMSFTTPYILTDADGNNYTTVVIGTQIWMADNLRTTKLNDNTPIPEEKVDTVWSALITPAYCLYNDNEANKNRYGALYNWYAISSGKLCPSGWHVPTDEEFNILRDYLGGESVAGGKLKETGTSHWKNPNTGATNESGFTALPTGRRSGSSSQYLELTERGYLWTSTPVDTTSAYYYSLFYNSRTFSSGSTLNTAGFAVRCVKD